MFVKVLLSWRKVCRILFLVKKNQPGENRQFEEGFFKKRTICPCRCHDKAKCTHPDGVARRPTCDTHTSTQKREKLYSKKSLAKYKLSCTEFKFYILDNVTKCTVRGKVGKNAPGKIFILELEKKTKTERKLTKKSDTFFLRAANTGWQWHCSFLLFSPA